LLHLFEVLNEQINNDDDNDDDDDDDDDRQLPTRVRHGIEGQRTTSRQERPNRDHHSPAFR